jgi:hypothetical protein
VKRLALLVGLVFFVGGIIFLIHPSITYRKHEEIAKIGPITATVEKRESAKIPLAATASLLIAGVVLIVLGARSKS